jgi:hypothetical protein
VEEQSTRYHTQKPRVRVHVEHASLPRFSGRSPRVCTLERRNQRFSPPRKPRPKVKTVNAGRVTVTSGELKRSSSPART